jgi:hypothetical protein
MQIPQDFGQVEQGDHKAKHRKARLQGLEALVREFDAFVEESKRTLKLAKEQMQLRR